MLSSPLFTQDREGAASRRRAYHSPDEGLSSSQSSSVSRRRGRPVGDQFDSLISNVKENPRRSPENEQTRVFWNDRESRFSLIVKQRFKNTNSRPIMTEEVFKSWMKLSSLKEEKFIVLIKETNNFDEINNFFMNFCWNKTGIFVKLMRKVSMRWKNWSDFKAQHSIQFRWENWSKIEILSLNSQARFRNYRIKLVVWMIREISKMQNQYAVDNPTLPVNQCFPHLIQILVEC